MGSVRAALQLSGAGSRPYRPVAPGYAISGADLIWRARPDLWDENDFSGQLSCCKPSPTGVGGGHATGFVVTKHGKSIRSAVAMDHYSLLATIEDGFGLPRLANGLGTFT
jgi:hypothetical protein